ncbi:KUP/HAK/KT family potassium transporter [Pandoraea pneumonica]|uniref:KUP/HAK/KT family potassium transporter n=1 Tax=Pandoraea pneumonica TaxID=2508299 RepID=UPI003CEF72F0
MGHETLIPRSSVPGMAAWRERLFVALQRSTVPTATSFGIPPAQAVTLGLELPI